MAHPPHLPPRPDHPPRKLKEFILFVFFVILLAFAAGMAAAAVAVAWILPPVSVTRPALTFFQNRQDPPALPSLTAEEKNLAEQSIVTIIDTRKKLAGDFYDSSGLIGEAALLTLDGWAVLWAPTLTAADAPYLRAVESHGRTRGVEKLISESTTGLVYLNIEGEGFPVFPLFIQEIRNEQIGWIFTNQEFRQTQLVLELPKNRETARSLTQMMFTVLPTAPVPGLLLNEKGELLGFAEKNRFFLLALEINRHLRWLQKNGTIVTKRFPVTGYVVEGLTKDERGVTQLQSGFFVTESGLRGKNGILPGDIIVVINGRDFQPQTAREEILSALEEMVMIVLRQGKEIEVRVQKI